MRELLVGCLLAVSAFGQGGVGLFTNSDDVGAPPLKGGAEFDAAAQQYRITGSGTDIWGRTDQFHYVWREMSGDFAIGATAKFLTEGIGHRKAVLMLRKSLDADSPFLQLAIHGDGTPSIQFRNAKGDTTNTVDFPVEGPGVWKLRLERQGTNITFWVSKDGAPMRELGHTITALGSPISAGLGVASHTQEAVNTVLFSQVSVEAVPPPGTLGIFSRSGDVGDPAIKGATAFSATTGEYRLTGSGANIWGRQDQFQYAWREVSGNFTVDATLRFLGEGAEHRKAGIMVRQSLDADSAYADIMIHGNGEAALQWRARKGEDTNTFDRPAEAPGTFHLRFIRNGVKMYLYLREGGELREIAHTEVSLQGPVLVGLAICAHDAKASETAVFSDVSIDVPPAAR